MRLLFAEDERSLSKAVVTILERNNYSVDAVYDGEEALAYCCLLYTSPPGSPGSYRCQKAPGKDSQA